MKLILTDIRSFLHENVEADHLLFLSRLLVLCRGRNSSGFTAGLIRVERKPASAGLTWMKVKDGERKINCLYKSRRDETIRENSILIFQSHGHTTRDEEYYKVVPYLGRGLRRGQRPSDKLR